MKKLIRKTLSEWFLIVVGTFLMSLSINFFLLPNKITVGGVSGISTILFYKFNLSMGFTILIFNIPLFIIAIKKFGFKFSIKSIVASILFAVFLDMIMFNNYIEKNKIDMVISAVYGGILLGVGLSLVFKAGASTGGSDLLAQILQNKDSKFNLSKILLIIDLTIIIFLIIFFKDINIGLYSITAIYMSTKIVEIIFEGVNRTKVVNVITKNDDKISNKIISVLNRGLTVTKCIGAYSRDEYIHITCVVTYSEINKLKEIVKNIDSNAFIYISNINKVWGKGFQKL